MEVDPDIPQVPTLLPDSITLPDSMPPNSEQGSIQEGEISLEGCFAQIENAVRDLWNGMEEVFDELNKIKADLAWLTQGEGEMGQAGSSGETGL
jgi:hypothetical protein